MHHAGDRHLHPASLTDTRIGLPGLVGLSPGLWRVPVGAGGAARDREALAGWQKRPGRRPALGQHPHALGQQGPQRLPLGESDLERRLRTGHAALGEGRSPPAALFRHAHRLAGVRQIGTRRLCRDPGSSRIQDGPCWCSWSRAVVQTFIQRGSSIRPSSRASETQAHGRQNSGA